MAIIGTLTSIGLWLVGADYWLLFGTLTGLLGIIPYAGIATAVLFSGLVTMASDISRLPWVLGVFSVTQQLEGHVVLPLEMRDRARLPAVPHLVFMQTGRAPRRERVCRSVKIPVGGASFKKQNP